MYLGYSIPLPWCTKLCFGYGFVVFVLVNSAKTKKQKKTKNRSCHFDGKGCEIAESFLYEAVEFN